MDHNEIKNKRANQYKNKIVNHRKKKKYIYFKLILFFVFLMAIISGISYAFYNLTVKSDKNVEVVAGKFKINFEEKNSIKLENAIPVSDKEGLADLNNIYEFSVTNEGTINSLYNLYLEETPTTNSLDKKYIRYSLKENDGEWSEPMTLSEGLRLQENKSLDASNKVDYKLKIWLSEAADNSIEGKSFSAKVVVDSVQRNASIKNKIQPIIKMPKTSIIVSLNDEFNDPEPIEVVDANGNTIDKSRVVKTYQYYDKNELTDVSFVDTSKKGIYYIYYEVTDDDGNTGCTVVSVCVCEKDTNLPTIKLNGEESIEIKKGATYQELGAVATDSDGAQLEVIKIGKVNTKVIGNYVIRYIAIDKNGNIVSVARNVNVIKTGSISISIGEISKKDDFLNIPVTMKATDGVIIGYYLSKNDTQPLSIDFNKAGKNDGVFFKNFEISESGTYYVWGLDSNDNIVNEKVYVDMLDSEGPICKFSDKNYMTIGTSTIDLICTDSSIINPIYLNDNNFIINNNSIAKITDISGYSKIEDGYKYTVTLQLLNQGEFTLSLKEKSISDVFNNFNKEVTTNISVKKLEIAEEDKTIYLNSGESKTVKMNNSIGNLTYKSSDDDIAYVDEDGTIYAGDKIGEAIITVTDSSTESTVEIRIIVSKKITVNYVKNGRNVDSIAKLTTKNTTCKLTTNNPNSCKITLPEFTTINDYEVVGWSENSTDYLGSSPGTEIEIYDDITLYSISVKKGKEYSVNWNSNGSILTGGETSCKTKDAYNDEEYIDSCSVQKPKIKSGNYTPNILGYNTNKNAHEALFTDDGSLELNGDNNGKTYYAISTSDSIKYTASLIAQSYPVLNMDEENRFKNTTISCTIAATYNGEEQSNSCDITLPNVNVLDGYTFVGWNKKSDATEGVAALGKISISEDINIYTITKFEEKSISANFHIQGIGVDKISSTQQRCTIHEKYNPKEAVENVCSIDFLNIPTITVKDNEKYEVIGWNEDSNAIVNSTKFKDDGSLELTDDTDFYSITKRKAVTLIAKWYSNGATLIGNDEKYDSSKNISKCVIKEVYNETEANKQDTKCSIITPTIERSTFVIDGYTDDDEVTEKSKVSFNSNDSIYLTTDKNIDIDAFETGKTWKAKTHKDITITWHTNGAKFKHSGKEVTNDITDKYTIMNESTTYNITSPEIIRDNYNIIGYGTSSNATESIWDSNTSKSVSESGEYYAVTSKNIEINVFYNDNDSVKKSTDSQIIYNLNSYNYKVPDNIVNSMGPRNLKYIGISSSLNSEELVENTNMIIESKTYYAVYNGNVDINFYYYEDESQEKETISTDISAVLKNDSDSTYTVKNKKVEVPSIIKESKKFNDSQSDESIKKYIGVSKNTTDKSVLDENDITTKNNDYYSVYKGIWKVTYTKDNSSVNSIGATYDSCDVYGLSNGSSYIEQGDNCTKILPSIELKEGYSDGKWYYGDQVIGSANELYNVDGFKTLIAKGSINKYTVKYDCTTNGGICDIPDKEVGYNELADLTPTATKEGYDFLGWNINHNESTALSESIHITNDITLYAIFRKTTTISLNSKAAEYTGKAIDANDAVVLDGDDSEIKYTYYIDNNCKTKTTKESGAISLGSAPIDADTYYVVASTKATNGKIISSNCVSHIITKKKINILWSDFGPFTYNGEEQSPKYSFTNDISNENLTLEQTKGTNVGKYTSTITLNNVIGGRAKTSNYELVNNTYNFNINPANGYVNLDNNTGTVTYGTNSKQFNIISTHGGNISVSEISETDANVSLNSDNNKTVTISNLENLNAKTVVTIRVTSEATDNYYAASTDYSLTIIKADSKCPSVKKYSDIYDGTAHSIHISGGSGGTIQYSTDNQSWSDNNPTYTDYTNGVKDIYVRVAETANYNANNSCSSSSIEIKQRPIICTSGSSKKTYDGTALTSPNSGECTNLVKNHIAVFSNHTGTITDAGTTENKFGNVEINNNKINVTNNYDITKQSGTLTIEKADAVNPTLTPYSGKYDGQPHSIGVGNNSKGGTVKYSIDNTTWSEINPTSTNVGTTTVYVKVEGDKNHNSTDPVSSTITIEKADNTISVAPATKLVYGSSSDMVTTTNARGTVYYSIETSLDENNYSNKGSITIPTAANKDAKIYSIYYYVTGDDNYKSKSGSVSVTIEKADNTISIVPNTGLVYDSSSDMVTTTNAKGTVYYSVGTSLNENNYNSVGSKSIPKVSSRNANTYKVYYYATGDTNYKPKSGSVSVTIEKADNTISVAPAEGLVYGSSSDMVTTTNAMGTVYYSVDESIDSSNYSNNSSTTIPKSLSRNADTYIIYYYVTGDTNYKPKSGSVSVTIEKAKGWIKLESDTGSINYGTNSSSFSISNSHGGDYSAEETTNNGVSVTVSENKVHISNLSSLKSGTKIAISVTSAATKNYTEASETYTLNIEQRSRKIYYSIGDGVSDIGKHSDSCNYSGESGTCDVTLPSITASSGYKNAGWGLFGTNTYNLPPNSVYNLSSLETEMTARAFDIDGPYFDGISTSITSCLSGQRCSGNITLVISDNIGPIHPNDGDITITCGDSWHVAYLSKTTGTSTRAEYQYTFDFTAPHLSTTTYCNIYISDGYFSDAAGNSSKPFGVGSIFSIIPDSSYYY